MHNRMLVALFANKYGDDCSVCFLKCVGCECLFGPAEGHLLIVYEQCVGYEMAYRIYVMDDHDDCHIFFGGDGMQKIGDDLLAGGIDSGKRLVEYEYLRVNDEGAGE